VTTLICGSLAYDTIMVFPDRFKNYILPDQIHILNVCFVNPEMRREYGGCAGNMPTASSSLGEIPSPWGLSGVTSSSIVSGSGARDPRPPPY